MSLDPQNIKRLKELERQLPKKIPIPNTNKNTSERIKAHQIEDPENSDNLFHKLIETSSDGSIPPHLINKLKELEKKEISNNLLSQKPKSKKLKCEKEEDILYLSFENLLLEEDL